MGPALPLWSVLPFGGLLFSMALLPLVASRFCSRHSGKVSAETCGVRMPSFFGYMAYSFAVLLPVFAVIAWLYL